MKRKWSLSRRILSVFIISWMLLALPSAATSEMSAAAPALDTAIDTSLDTSIGTSIDVNASTSIPSYTGEIFTVLNNNVPSFSEKQKQRTDAFETYSKLDSLGRCGVAFANICEELQPTGERGNISSVHPTGWVSGVGYNRCHLIGYQLAGENANKRNLITGTQYFNVSGMLPFENMVDDYVEETGNHVLYRVTPRFKDSDLVARGVQMEAWSVEDHGEGICFNVFVHNVFKEGKTISYKTGKVTQTAQSVTITVKTTSKTYKKSELKNKAKTFSMGIKVSSGTFTCKKISGSSKLTVSSKGKVTVKKGTGKGTYTAKVKITAGSKSVTKKVTVKVTSSSSGKVWITATGSKYHSKNNCGNTNPKTATQITEEEAIRRGYEKCKKCW